VQPYRSLRLRVPRDSEILGGHRQHGTVGDRPGDVQHATQRQRVPRGHANETLRDPRLGDVPEDHLDLDSARLDLLDPCTCPRVRSMASAQHEPGRALRREPLGCGYPQPTETAGDHIGASADDRCGRHGRQVGTGEREHQPPAAAPGDLVLGRVDEQLLCHNVLGLLVVDIEQSRP
jgi:hypothetical protein